jgi:hypothetical protein
MNATATAASTMPAATAGISAARVSAVLATRHQKASGPDKAVSGFVVTDRDGTVQVTCRYYHRHPGVGICRVLAQVYGAYARTLRLAGYLTEPRRDGRRPAGLTVTGRTGTPADAAKQRKHIPDEQ